MASARCRRGGGRRRSCRIPPASRNTTNRVERQQRERGEQRSARADLRGSLILIGLPARIERGYVERRKPVGGRKRVHRQQSFRRSVEAGRMIGGGAAGEAAGTGRAVGGGGPNTPKPSRTRVGGNTSRARASACGIAVGRRRPNRRATTMRLSISTNVPDSGRSDQRVSAVTWNKTIRPLPRRCGGDQRRAVGERRPGALGQCRVGLGQHLAAHRHVGRHRHAEERAFAREGGELLRLLPATGCRRERARRGAASPAPDRRRRRRAAGRRSAPARRRPRSSA